MKINILLPYKEKFDVDYASSVSITVKNNLFHSRFLEDIKIFGQNVDNPILKNNFVGIKYSILSFKSKNRFLAKEMLRIIFRSNDKKQLIEIHNRPYLVNYIYKKTNSLPLSLFFHTDPKTMKGSRTKKERENILNKCAAIYCVSEYIKQQFLDGINIDKQKVHLLYNGVNRISKQFPVKKKEVIFVGRLVEEKGVDIFVDAIKSIACYYQDWKFILIGPTNLGKKNKTNFYAHKVSQKFISIGDQAKFYGFKDNEFVQNVMKNASIIIIPSRVEAFGLVIAEAMSNGLAIIASNVGAIPEVLKDNGILIENINELKLRNSLIKLIENPNIREKFQRKSWKNFKFSSVNSSKQLDNSREFLFQNHC